MILIVCFWIRTTPIENDFRYMGTTKVLYTTKDKIIDGRPSHGSHVCRTLFSERFVLQNSEQWSYICSN